MARTTKSMEFVSNEDSDSHDDADVLTAPTESPQSTLSDDQTPLTTGSNPTSSPKRKRSKAKEKSTASIPGAFSLLAIVLDVYNLCSASVNITFDITVFSIADMKKSSKLRGAGTSSYIVFLSSEPWDTLKAQLLAKISNILDPDHIAFEDYHITFTVPRHSKTPLPLVSSDDFAQLLQRTLKTKMNLTAKIVIEARVPPKPSGKKASDSLGSQCKPDHYCRQW
jgi:hypothetical protein